MKERHIEKEFESYRERVIHPEASEDQVTETRRGFYAGAVVAFAYFFGENAAIDSSPEEAFRRVTSFHAELEEFNARVGIDR